MVKNNKGFTLLEMLAVMAILGIVFSIGYVSMQSSLDSTKRAACQNKLELVASAEKRFFATQNHHSLEFESLGSIDGDSELVDRFYLDWNQNDNFSINVEIETESPLVYRLSCSEYDDVYILQDESEYRRDYFLTYPTIPDEGDEDDIDLEEDYEEDLSELDIIWEPDDDYTVSIGFNENHLYEIGSILYFDEPVIIDGVTYETGIYQALVQTSDQPDDTNVTEDPDDPTGTWLFLPSDELESNNQGDPTFYIIPEGEDSVEVPRGNSFIIGHDDGVYIDASEDSTANNNNNFIAGGDGDDILIGGSRRDTILGQEGNDFIDGNSTLGGRENTAVFAYPINQYTLEIVTIYDDYMTIDFKGDPIDLYIGDDTLYLISHPIEGDDYLIRIHNVYFSDGTVTMSEAFNEIGQ